MTDLTNTFCHKCVPKKQACDFYGAAEGVCPGSCNADQDCETLFSGCHRCIPKKTYTDFKGFGGTYGYGQGWSIGSGLELKYKLGADYTNSATAEGGTTTGTTGGEKTTDNLYTCWDNDLYSSCRSCQEYGEECIPEKIKSGVQCYYCKDPCGPYYASSYYCRECEWEGGACVPAGGRVGPPIPKTNRQCYDCVWHPKCEDYGMVCSSGACRPGTTPVGPYYPGPYEEVGPCYKCVKAMIPYGPYIIVIIERPVIRSILGIPASLEKFIPSSIMALTKVDPAKMGEIQKLAGLVKGKIISFANLDEASQALQKSLLGKRSFNDDCFSDFKAAPMPQTPPTGSSFGQDLGQKLSINGPIVACGQTNGKDTLGIFTSEGNPVVNLLRDQMGKDNTSILSALNKSEEINQKWQQLLTSKPKDWLKGLKSAIVDKIMTPRDSKKKEAKPTKLEPNDPLYYKNYGKKVSQVAERMKKVAASPMGTGIIMGGVEIGGGAAAYDDKKGPDVQDQWGIRKVGFLPKSDPKSAWNVVDGRQKNVVVAVIDSGFDFSHPDAPENIWLNGGETPGNNIDDDGNGYIDDVNGWNFIDNNTDMRDFNGHGTFVAGIIAAKANNGIGIAGINPGAIIMPLRVADAKGQASSFDVFRAINYAVDQGAKVINLSLGSRGVSPLEDSAIARAHEKGVFIAVASGNVGENIADHGPASAPGATAVGSLDFDGKKSTISNWGGNNGLIAPGEKIYSLRSIDSFDPKKVSRETEFYYAMSGTSFAAPIVAATASLVWAKNPQLTNTQIEDILQDTSEDMYDRGWDGESGAGLLNANKALARDAAGLQTVKIIKVRVNRDENKQLTSIDVYATARGEIAQFTVELGKGKKPGGFRKVAGPFTQTADNAWVAQISEKEFRGSDDWAVRIHAQDKDDKDLFAQTWFSIRNK